MKICLSCDNELLDFRTTCTCCGMTTTEVDGILQLAPWVAKDGVGWKSDYFSRLYEVEASSFWFQGRNEFLKWAVRKYVVPRARFLEIGCGTGYVLAGLCEEFPQTDFTGSEFFGIGLGYAAQRLKGAELVQMDARRLPYRDEFDGIGAFDVLEHIAEDEEVLVQIFAALRPGGHVVLTVPQHPVLWSSADEIACHERRYTRRNLEEKVEAAGFRILRSTSFISFLLPLMFASRWLNRKTQRMENDPTIELRLPKAINFIFRSSLAMELLLVARTGFNFPLGGSRLLIARKE